MTTNRVKRCFEKEKSDFSKDLNQFIIHVLDAIMLSSTKLGCKKQDHHVTQLLLHSGSVIVYLKSDGKLV